MLNACLKGSIAGAFTLLAASWTVPVSAADLEVPKTAVLEKAVVKRPVCSTAGTGRRVVANHPLIRVASLEDERVPACPGVRCFGLTLGVGF